jgi:DNA-binding response OmpR family regulator
MPAPEHAHVLLCAIEDNVANQLQNMLASLGDEVSRNPISLKSADLVFCGPDPDSLQRLLRAVKRSRRQVPVVVVSSDADVNSWLDALEAGADDYLPAPVERTALNWIREAQLTARQSTAVC